MAFPNAVLLDNFNRADAQPPSASWGDDWTGNSLAQPQIISNECAADTGSNTGSSYWNPQAFTGDVEIYVTVPVVGTANLVLALHLSDLGLTVDGYSLLISGSTWFLSRIDDGSGTQILNADQAISDGDSVGVELVGDTFTLYYKPSGGSWTALDTVTDSTYTSGYLGLIILGATDTRIDDFGGGNPAVVVQPDFIPSSAQLFTPTISTETINVSAPFIASSAQIFTPSTSVEPITVEAPFIASAATLYTPSISTESITAAPAFVASTASIFTPTIQTETITAAPEFLASTAQIYTPNISVETQTATPAFLPSSAAIFTPTIVLTPVTTSPDFLPSTVQVFTPTITTETIIASPSFLAPGSALFTPVISLSPVTVQPAFLVSSSQVYTPTVTVFAGAAPENTFIIASPTRTLLPEIERMHTPTPARAYAPESPERTFKPKPNRSFDIER